VKKRSFYGMPRYLGFLTIYSVFCECNEAQYTVDRVEDGRKTVLISWPWSTVSSA